MKKNKLTALFVLTIIAVATKAQVPGFMGKKMYIGAEGYIFPAAQPTPAKPGGSGFNTRWGVAFHHVLSRKTSMGISYQFNNTSEEFGFDDFIEKKENPFYYRISAQTVAVNFTFYSVQSQYIAPVGRYYSLELLFTNYKVIDNKGHLYSPGTLIMDGGTWGTAFTLGKKSVFFKSVVFDYGLQLAYLFENKTQHPQGGQQGAANDALGRLRQTFIANVKLGVGYLL